MIRSFIRISDQGSGFDPDEKFNPPRGWGLAGMRERVKSLDGQLNLKSAPGQGTSVEVVIPCEIRVERNTVIWNRSRYCSWMTTR